MEVLFACSLEESESRVPVQKNVMVNCIERSRRLKVKTPSIARLVKEF